MSACALAMQSREEEYLQVAPQYDRKELDEFGKALGMLIDEMHDKPFEDCLGTFYTEIASKSTVNARGEFYTPPCISELMAQMLFDVDQVIEEGRPVTINEPACGSGGIILAVAKQFSPIVREGEKSYVDLLRVTMQDIAPTSVDMAYINTTLWGIPSKIILGDTLRGTTDKMWHNIHWTRVGETERRMLEYYKNVLSEPAEAQERKESASTDQDAEDFSQLDFQF